MGDQEPTETSPLLTKSANVVPEPGDAPVGALPTGSGVNGHANGDFKPGDDEETQGELDRINQYEGMPEVKAKLKYIMPAIAIGVRCSFLRCNHWLINRRSSCPLETRPLLCQAMARLAAS